jgi:NAD(P)-dependent dehydrogenase (short-subunit alcohol dehydrogenase family)
MSNKKVWFVTGASRGMGVEFVKAALAAGVTAPCCQLLRGSVLIARRSSIAEER